MAIKKTTSVIELMEAAKDLGSIGNTLRKTNKPLIKRQDDKTTKRQDDNCRNDKTAIVVTARRQLPQQQDDKTQRQDNKTTRRQSLQQDDKTARRQIPSDLTEKQYSILWYIYFNRPFKISGPNGVGELLKIPYGTVRSSFRSLVKKYYISKPYAINIETKKYSTCEVNYEKCLSFLGPTQIPNPQKKPTKWTLQQDDKTTRRQNIRQDNKTTKQQDDNSYNSSSSFICTKTTTTIKNINIELNKTAELGYWRQKKITVKQINEWMKTANCNLDMMIQYLCYCRFEMVDLNFEKSKPIENVFNWFFRMLEKTGGYPKPKGYKSFREKKIKAERQIVKQKEKEAQEIRELHQRKIKAEQDKKFWDMMNDPEGELFKKCFEKINSFQKRKPAGKGFEISMRSIFDKITLEA